MLKTNGLVLGCFVAWSTRSVLQTMPQVVLELRPFPPHTPEVHLLNDTRTPHNINSFCLVSDTVALLC